MVTCSLPCCSSAGLKQQTNNPYAQVQQQFFQLCKYTVALFLFCCCFFLSKKYVLCCVIVLTGCCSQDNHMQSNGLLFSTCNHLLLTKQLCPITPLEMVISFMYCMCCTFVRFCAMCFCATWAPHGQLRATSTGLKSLSVEHPCVSSCKSCR